MKLNKPTGKIKRRGDSLSNSHTIMKGFDWFLLWHLKPSWPCIQQVGCSSAEGLVVRGVGWGRDLALGGGVGSKGMTDGPRVECQNHKSNLSLTPSSYKVYLHFHIAYTSKTSMFRHFKAAWHAHLSCYQALRRQGAGTSLSHPDLTGCQLISSPVQGSLKGSFINCRFV